MDWFRMYGAMPDDPKVGTLTDADFRTWVELLCLACREELAGVTTANPENINWLLRRNVTGALQVLLQRGLIHQNEHGFIVITKWAERQKPSDTSKNRVQKYREKKRGNVTVTLQKRYCNGLEKRREDKKEEPPTPLPEWIEKETWDAFKEMRDKKKKPLDANAEKLALAKLENLKLKGHNPNEIIRESIINNWQGLFEPKERQLAFAGGSNRGSAGKNQQQKITAGTV